MKSNWISKIWVWILLGALFLSVPPVRATAPDSSAAPKQRQRKSVWSRVTSLVRLGARKANQEKMLEQAERVGHRLQEEQWKIQVVFGEIDKLNNATNDLRDLQLYPTSLTKTQSKWAAKFDKKLEKQEKTIKKLRGRVDELNRPLLDAIAILREMSGGELSGEMLEILLMENKKRVKAILQLKRDINDQWKAVNGLFESLAGFIQLRVEEPKASSGFDAEFFAILHSNLGQSSDLFHQKVQEYRDTLAQQGNKTTWKQMASIDLARIQDRINQGLYENAAKGLEGLTKRYTGKIEIGGAHYLYAKNLLALGRYREANAAFVKIPTSSSYYSQAKLGQMQASFLLEQYKEVMKLYGNWLDANLTSKEHNFAILLVCQSAYRTGLADSVVGYVGAAKPKQPFYAEILLTLAQVYLQKGDSRTGTEILQKVIQFPATARGELTIVAKTRLLLGYLYYEQAKYELAVKEFFKAIDEPVFFAEGLFGIVWSYMKSGLASEAEIALRKLINQNPDHYLAVEGILVLAEKMTARAQLEWSYTKFCEEEARRIKDLEKRLQQRIKLSFLSEREIKEAKAKIDELKQRHAKRKPLRREEIGKTYDMAAEICSIIFKNYRAGFYLETTASGRREQLINQLDALYASIQAQEKSLLPDEIDLLEKKKRTSVAAVKDAVQRGRIFNIRLLIARRVWENEYANEYLTELNRELANLRDQDTTATDSTIKAKTQKQMAGLVKARDAFVQITEQEKATRRQQIIKAVNTARREYVLTGEQEQYLLYQLGELHYEADRDEYMSSLLAYEAELSRLDNLKHTPDSATAQERSISLKPPKLEYSKAISIFKDLVGRYPEGKYADAALYSLGFCYSDLAEDSLAHLQFERLVGNFPQSPHTPQAYMIIGEYWFNRAELAKAVLAYTKVLEYTESEWFDEAIYKLGWSYYRLSNAKKAISSFLYLMSDSELNLSGKGSTSTKYLLEKESIDYIAISFAEETDNWKGGVEKAKTFVRRINDDRKGVRIMHKLADVYRAKGTDASLRLSLKAYQSLLDMFPHYERNPQVESDIIAVYEKQNKTAKCSQMRLDIFRKYNQNSTWAKANTSKAAVAMGDSIARAALYDAAQYYVLEAAQNSDLETYQKAMQAYEWYVATYPQDEKASECHYNIAEIMFSLGDYQKASTEYMKVSRLYEQSSQQETAAWNAIVSAQNYKKLMARQKGDSQ